MVIEDYCASVYRDLFKDIDKRAGIDKQFVMIGTDLAMVTDPASVPAAV
jgi:hypothetical protein